MIPDTTLHDGDEETVYLNSLVTPQIQAEETPEQPRESKLKTILLGTPEQREARFQEMEENFREHTRRELTRFALEPGYITRLAIYIPEGSLSLRLKATACDLVRTAAELYGLGTLATKLGQIFY